MLNEEISNDVKNEVAKPAVRLIWETVGKPTGKKLISVLTKAVTFPARKAMDQIKNPKGKMSVKTLLRKDQGAQAIDISELGLGDFKRIANKYGVDFAIVKSRHLDPPKYTVFFKARDADAINNVVAEYTAKRLKIKTKGRPSILAKLQKFKEIVAKMPGRAREKRKEQER